MPTVAKESELLDRLWKRVCPLLPPAKPMPKGGRPRADDRACLEGIVYVLRNGLRWRDVPAEYPSGPTCWRAGINAALPCAQWSCSVGIELSQSAAILEEC